MKIKEYGKNDKPMLVLIHGGGLGHWSWGKLIDKLGENYCIKAVVIDGHGDDYETEFVSIEDTADKIRRYLRENDIARVHAICGLSIGAQIAVELLVSAPDLADHWVIESALVVPMNTMTKWMLPLVSLAYPLVNKRWYAKLQAQMLCISEGDFEVYFRDSGRMSLNTLKAMTISNGTYELKAENIRTNSDVLIFVGAKEPKIMIESARQLLKAIPDSKLEILEGYRHGELSLKHCERYAGIIEGLRR